MAGLPATATVRQADLSKATDVSGHFLSKVLQQLVRSGLIRSQRGSGGGYGLAISAYNVSLLDVVQALEGPIQLNQCIAEGPSCERKSWCPAHQVWAEARAAVVNILGDALLADLAAQAKASVSAGSRQHGQAVWISGAER
jgi:Rrf2 family protein